MGFMLNGITNERRPVLLEISIDNRVGFGLFKMDKENYSVFPNEKEVLLRDGHRYLIERISLEMHSSGI